MKYYLTQTGKDFLDEGIKDAAKRIGKKIVRGAKIVKRVGGAALGAAARGLEAMPPEGDPTGYGPMDYPPEGPLSKLHREKKNKDK